MNRREFLKGAIRGLAVAIVPVVLLDVSGSRSTIFTLQEGGFVERTTKVATVDYWNLKPSDKDTYKIL